MKQNFECNECGKRFVSALEQPSCPQCFGDNCTPLGSGKKPKAAPAPKSLVESIAGGEVKSAWVQSSGIRRASTIPSEDEFLTLGPDDDYLRKLLSWDGLPTGSLIFFYGDAGVGKSTFAVKMLDSLIAQGHKVLYVTSEERDGNVAKRIGRISPNADQIDVVNIYALSDENMAPDVLGDYEFVIIDSVNAFIDNIKTVVTYLRQIANQTRTSFLLIGHVIKSGDHEGPETLKHIVDVVWEAYGQSESSTRTIVAVKNRYNKLNAVFYELGDKGVTITNGESDHYLLQRKALGGQMGSVLTVLPRGSTYIPIDVQATFVDADGLRVASSNVSVNKLRTVFSTVFPHLQHRVGYVTVELYGTSGYRVQSEADVNLPMAVSIYSAAFGFTVPAELAILGTMDLSGRIYAPADLNSRIERVAPYVKTVYGPIAPVKSGAVKYVGVHTFKELVGKLFGNQSGNPPAKNHSKKATSVDDLDFGVE